MDREGANKQFTNAKKAKNDEFYTQYEDIQKKLTPILNIIPIPLEIRRYCCRVMILNGAVFRRACRKLATQNT